MGVVLQRRHEPVRSQGDKHRHQPTPGRDAPAPPCHTSHAPPISAIVANTNRNSVLATDIEDTVRRAAEITGS